MNPFEKVNIIEYRNGMLSESTDAVASETRLKIFANGRELLSLLCSPVMVKELIVGFGLSEGLLNGVDWCSERLEIFYKDEEIEAHLPVDVPEAAPTLTSGCAKGITFAGDPLQEEYPIIQDDLKIKTETVFGLFSEFQKQSHLYRTTGGAHSAAICDEQGIVAFAEDIGRHNAVDKIIGYCFLENVQMNGKILLLSGRLSSEIVSKAARAKVPVLVSRTAPTTMAIDIARRVNITLIGFLRGHRLNVYSHPERIMRS